MKRGKLTFRNFRGLDWRTASMGTSPVGKPSEVGFESMYGFIKEDMLHPLPTYSLLQAGSGRLFEVDGDMYFMYETGISKRNGTAFVAFITHTFYNSPTYWDMKPFFEVIAAGAVGLTYLSSTDQSIIVTNTMPINAYVNKHVIIGTSPNTQCLYITGNDAHTLYTDGLINGSIAGPGIGVNVYDKDATLIVYDGQAVHRFQKSTGTALGTADSFTNGFIEIFSNRLFLLKDNQIIFSTFNSSIFLNTPFNYIDSPGVIVDKCIIGNVLVVFTSNGTFGLTGTGFTTMNFPKISEFAPKGRVYPCAQLDKTYIIWDAYVRKFNTNSGLESMIYNYNVIPDTQGKIYAIERGVIFPLGHGTTQSGLINIEEIQNRVISSIQVGLTNFYDAVITDLLEYNGSIFIIAGGNIYKESGVSSPTLECNAFRLPQKMFWDSVDMQVGGTYPASIDVTLDGVVKTCGQSTGANQVIRPIRDSAYAIQVAMTSTEPIVSFNINYIQ